MCCNGKTASSLRSDITHVTHGMSRRTPCPDPLLERLGPEMAVWQLLFQRLQGIWHSQPKHRHPCIVLPLLFNGLEDSRLCVEKLRLLSRCILLLQRQQQSIIVAMGAESNRYVFSYFFLIVMTSMTSDSF